MPTNTNDRDYNYRVGDITNPEIYINPTPGNMQQRGRGHVALFR